MDKHYKNKEMVNTETREVQDFPGGAVDTQVPANAGDTGSIPGPGGVHMPKNSRYACAPKPLKPTGPRASEPQIVRLCAATTEARTPRACARQRGATADTRVLCRRAEKLEKVRVWQWRPSTAKSELKKG